MVLGEKSRVSFFLCAALLAIFASVAWLEIRLRCATFDETVHAPASWMVRYRQDFRLNPEDPPLWQYWAALQQPANALRPDAHPDLWAKVLHMDAYQTDYCSALLYQTPGVDADAFLNRSRIMMLALALAAGGLCAIFAYRIAGSAAAVFAAALFCFDPTLIGHGALVKNDVPMALVTLATLYATWRLGRRVTVSGVIALGLALGAALATKFSALLLLPIVALLLIGRALTPGVWDFPTKTIERGARKLSAVLGIGVIVGALAIGVIWASYGFRYRPANDAAAELDTPALLQYAARAQWDQQHTDGSRPTQEFYDRWQPTGILRPILVAREMHLLPQAWLHGLTELVSASAARDSYLDGQFSKRGFRSYFPLAILYKTPLTTLAAGGLALLAGVIGLRNLRGREPLWTLGCLLLPIVVYGSVAISSPLNIGLRHVLPLYPLFFILIAWGLAGVWGKNKGDARDASLFPQSKACVPFVSRILIVLLGVALATESLTAFPNHLAYFNRAAGGTAGGLHHLGDSNLDWGQDLKALVAWQNEHPKFPIYLCYFGSASPQYYGLRYSAVAGISMPQRETIMTPATPGVLAISATNLQGIYLPAELRAQYAPLQSCKPLAVLGGSIYLFDWPMKPELAH